MKIPEDIMELFDEKTEGIKHGKASISVTQRGSFTKFNIVTDYSILYDEKNNKIILCNEDIEK